MPGSILNADTNFPNLEGKTNEEKFQLISNYLYMLLEQLRYTLNNLGENNWNEEEMTALKSGITKESVKQVVGGLEITAENNGMSSTIKLSSGEVDVSSAQVNITGAVTFSDLSGNGTTTINGANIKTGYLSADRVSGGTLQGVVVKSADYDSYTGVQIENGRVTVSSDPEGAKVQGTLKYDTANDRVWLQSAICPMKIDSGSNISIDAAAGKVVYIGTSGNGQTVQIGKYEAEAIRLTAQQIYINGTPIDDYIASVAGG